LGMSKGMDELINRFVLLYRVRCRYIGEQTRQCV
jgi:hypothetical protein